MSRNNWHWSAGPPIFGDKPDARNQRNFTPKLRKIYGKYRGNTNSARMRDFPRQNPRARQMRARNHFCDILCEKCAILFGKFVFSREKCAISRANFVLFLYQFRYSLYLWGALKFYTDKENFAINKNSCLFFSGISLSPCLFRGGTRPGRGDIIEHSRTWLNV